MKKILSILLAAAMILIALVSCVGNEEVPEETIDDTVIVLFEKGIEPKYKVVYSDDITDNKVISSAKGIAYQIEQKFGYDDVECTAEYRSYKIINDYEIIIGNVGNRPEVPEALALLQGAENEYVIKMFESGRLVIVASNDEALAKAVNYFINAFILEHKGDKLTIKKDYCYYADLGSEGSPKWSLNAPEYVGGQLARNAYITGFSRNLTNAANGGKMHVISNTTSDEFNAYISTLSSEGYVETAKTENNGNIYVQYHKKVNGTNKLVYAYYINALKEARVIDDYCSIPETEFEYEYDAGANGTTTYYQYGLMHDPYGLGNDPNTKDNEIWGNAGAFDIIKLADNKLILIDGGGSEQATPEATAALVDFLYEITGTPEGEKVVIAAWFMTHPHGDHLYHVKNLATKYGDKFVFERIMNNFRSTGEIDGGFATAIEAINKNNPDAKYIKLHTGQNITLGNINIDVLMTHEDAVNPTTGKTFIIDENNSSVILKINTGSKSIMYFGDWGGNDQNTQEKRDEYQEMQRRLFAMYETETGVYPTLKADIVQIAHHSINHWLEKVYQAVDPDYAFFSQADIDFFYYNKITHSCYLNVIEQMRAFGVADENMYFAGRKTNWLVIASNGTVTHGEKKLEGAKEGYWYFVDANGKNIVNADGSLHKVASIEEIDALGITTIIKDVTYNAQSDTWTIRDEYDRIISGENGAINLTSFSTASDLGAVKAVHVAGYWEYLEGIKPWNS